MAATAATAATDDVADETAAADDVADETAAADDVADETDKLSVLHKSLIRFIRYAAGHPLPHLLPQ